MSLQYRDHPTEHYAEQQDNVHQPVPCYHMDRARVQSSFLQALSEEA